MPRHRSFDESEVLDAMMNVFWEHGYEATNMDYLEAATNLARTSLYNAFGNKSELFSLALSRYHEMTERHLDASLSTGGVEALEKLFQELSQSSIGGIERKTGCLMVAAATISPRLEERHRGLVLTYREMLAEKFRTVLEDALSAKQVRSDLDPANAAQLLVCFFWGALVSQCSPDAQGSDTFGLHTLRQILSDWRVSAIV